MSTEIPSQRAPITPPDDFRTPTRTENAEAGFSLVELLASTVLLIIGMLFFASLFGSAMAAFVKTERTRVGKTYAEAGMGEIATRSRYKFANPSNLGLNKTATQSSTLTGAPTATAGKAIDGNTDGNFSNGSVSHTNSQTNAWWQVDLGTSQQIQTIKIWNRTDCCAERLMNFYVFVSDSNFVATNPFQLSFQPGVSTYQTTGAAGTLTTINVNRTGRYVRVTLGDNNYLQLAEVEITGINFSATPQAVPDGGTITPGATCVAPYCDRIYQPARRQGAPLPPPVALPPTGTVPTGAQLLFIRRYTVRTVDAATNVREITMTLAATTSETPFLTRTTRVLANK